MPQEEDCDGDRGRKEGYYKQAVALAVQIQLSAVELLTYLLQLHDNLLLSTLSLKLNEQGLHSGVLGRRLVRCSNERSKIARRTEIKQAHNTSRLSRECLPY